MELIVIILILLGALIILFATKFLSKTFKIITKVMLILIIILVVLTLLVYKDMNELKQGFVNKNNTFFLYEDNKLYSAVTLKPMTSTNLSIDSFNYFTLEELEQAEDYLNKKNYQALLNNNYRIFLLSTSILKKPYALELGGTLNQDDLLDVIISEDPFVCLAEKTQAAYNADIETLRQGFKDMYGNQEKLKGYLFAALLTNYFQKQEAGELVSNIKNKKIRIYPETISFKIIKYLPWM